MSFEINKPWAIIRWNWYYPREGLGNILSVHETEEKARAVLDSHLKKLEDYWENDIEIDIEYPESFPDETRIVNLINELGL